VPNKEHPMRSSLIGPEFWVGYCKRVFGDDVPVTGTVATNAHFGGLDITGSNIFFIDGSEDPW